MGFMKSKIVDDQVNIETDVTLGLPLKHIELSPARPNPAPRPDHSDFSEETLSAYLDRLERWKPTQEDEKVAKAWIEWLDKVFRVIIFSVIVSISFYM
jgi:hypothetical protein